MKVNKIVFLIIAPLLFVIFQQFDPPAGMSDSAYDILTATLWIAIWWVTEAVPIAVTALLPIVLFPLTGALDISTTTASYGHKYVFLYMGGFILAIAIEKWGLHKRIALHIIKFIGTNVKRIILGFMVATAFLSMWISNTATSVMMLPIGMSIVAQLRDNPNTLENENKLFGKALMLGIAYSASIGGMATLIGTPPNLVFAGYIQEVYNIDISFFQWFKFGLPISILLLGICWFYLTNIAFQFKQKEFPGGKQEINRLIKELGPVKKEEKIVTAVFIGTAICWITRSFLLEKIFPGIDDTIIAIAAGILLFTLTLGSSEKRILNWEEAVKMPWGIILLFGGGMALASGFEETGLAKWFGLQMTLLESLPLFLLVLIVIFSVNFITELTSNLATTAMLLPILAPIALELNLNPYMLLVATTVAASCAFMLPVATPPNAVVFGSGYLRIPDMVKAGVWMNIFSILILTILVYFMLPFVWDFDPFGFSLKFQITS
ncbi:SLC13 family permease [Leeuwenhoekiella marinoflava]|uniref:Sodium-dependent dicarboxylate transporter 2/3/5 n=2 Tax=Leeuwenhoekiella marinoflava TaxID=988 RepID=A0A4Q0PKR4_9FLAO|nr:DASS family sodium-coupled anion symporter [Leeuwenhoekiella marinoflava]RXG28368.1 sodium-dependent dicarboxylate transporter 2/3/5 [Leeuwenhoekiella marinoflava]SHF54883.1 solute carrier family 13 (sodium-dependent dicarboxylate transporter), member 2/3/5 [Leeuwenhoekiella marinoflava DSM 3653]